MRISDWSSDVCSSDLAVGDDARGHGQAEAGDAASDDGADGVELHGASGVRKTPDFIGDRRIRTGSGYGGPPAGSTGAGTPGRRAPELRIRAHQWQWFLPRLGVVVGSRGEPDSPHEHAPPPFPDPRP